jgi:nitrogen fixation protein FixH
MTDAAANTRGFRFTGWHFLAIIVSFFLVVIAVDVGFATMAYRTYPGEVSRTPYEDGVTYNRQLAQMAAQAKLGWTVSAGLDADGAILVQVRDRAGAPVRGLTSVAKLERPATEAGRIIPRFAETAPGDYVARPSRMTGTWDLSVTLKDAAGHSFEAERRLSWR